MRKEKYSIDELLEQLRKKSVFKVADVEFASLDSNGELSVLLKKAKQPVKYEDICNESEEESASVTVLADGKIIEENLSLTGMDYNALKRKIQERGYKPQQVFYAEVDSKGHLSIDLYDE